MGLLRSNDFKNTLENHNALRNRLKEKRELNNGSNRKLFNSLLIYDAVNRYYSLKDILEDIGCDDLGATNCLCPFHGEIKGLSKPSAKYYPDSDTLYCYQEGKSYTAYHGIKLLLLGDVNVYFQEAWINLDETTKEELIQKYGEGSVESNNSRQLEPYKEVYEEFISGNIPFKTYRIALRKILYEIYTEEREKTLKEIFKKKKSEE